MPEEVNEGRDPGRRFVWGGERGGRCFKCVFERHAQTTFLKSNWIFLVVEVDRVGGWAERWQEW